ncbi:MAG TPA: glycerol-3-phosphate acyltransferase, partial [Thermoanaerobaculia bacterium]|nr:glycerol-3-phosphate acyltransferase [Thermoanaerobaculia bacterium]
MPTTVAVPLWIAVLAALLAAWAVLDRLLVPGLRWLVRRRTERLLEKLETRFRIRVEPFKRTKREALVERLVWDSQVQAAAEAVARS